MRFHLTLFSMYSGDLKKAHIYIYIIMDCVSNNIQDSHMVIIASSSSHQWLPPSPFSCVSIVCLGWWIGAAVCRYD